MSLAEFTDAIASQINNPYRNAGYDTYHIAVLGFQVVADRLFDGNLDLTLAHLLDPETQDQSLEGIRIARESHRWLTDQNQLKE